MGHFFFFSNNSNHVSFKFCCQHALCWSECDADSGLVLCMPSTNASLTIKYINIYIYIFVLCRTNQVTAVDILTEIVSISQ